MPGQPLKQWTGDTPWRQGCVLGASDARVLGLSNSSDDANEMVMVVSHDCDLASDNLTIEPHVEVVVGRFVEAVNGTYTWGKSPRTLHLAIERRGAPVAVELVATSKRLVPKRSLAQFVPDAEFVIDRKGIGVLRGWLSARYNRTAFPNALVDRLKVAKFDVKLAKILEPQGDLISFVYFDIGNETTVERQKDDPYELSIVLVYPPGDDPDATAEAADRVADAIETAAFERLKVVADITFKRCFAMSEDDLPISQARVLMQWRLEHMTHRDEGHPGPIAL